MPVKPPTLTRDGLEWIEIKTAAKFSRTKTAVIQEQVDRGSILSISIDGRTHIALSAAMRLKSEAKTMAEVKRLNRKRVLRPARNFGMLVKDTQDVLPMSSGRGGRGWLGQRKD